MNSESENLNAFTQAEYHLDQATIYLDETGELDKALAECDAAIELNPHLADAYNLRGIVLEELGRTLEAMDAYERAIRLDPDFVEARENLSDLRQESQLSGSYEETGPPRSQPVGDTATAKTDLAMMADIQTQGRTREQIEAQLRQKIEGFNREAMQRYGDLGFNLKEVRVLAKESGKCIIITDPLDSENVLKLQELLPALWNEIAWPEAGEAQPFAVFERLVEELVDIGCSTRREKGPSYFWMPGEEVKKNPRVIEIGRELYYMGDKTLHMMRRAALRIAVALGVGAANDLSHHWHEIGLEEWRKGEGDFWAA
jgi:hypothetical protein